jgi:hypothetical protein
MKKRNRLTLFLAIMFLLGTTACGNDSQLAQTELKNQKGEPVMVFPSEKPALIFLFTTAG